MRLATSASCRSFSKRITNVLAIGNHYRIAYRLNWKIPGEPTWLLSDREN